MQEYGTDNSTRAGNENFWSSFRKAPVNSTIVIANIIVFIIDFIYFKNKQSVLYKRFKEISKQKKKRKDVFCIIYIVSIIIVNVLISNYLRSKNMA